MLLNQHAYKQRDNNRASEKAKEQMQKGNIAKEEEKEEEKEGD